MAILNANACVAHRVANCNYIVYTNIIIEIVITHTKTKQQIGVEKTMAKQTGVYQMRTDDEFKHALEAVSKSRNTKNAEAVRQLVFDAYTKLKTTEKQGKQE